MSGTERDNVGDVRIMGAMSTSVRHQRIDRESEMRQKHHSDIPLGRAKTPDSEPFNSALLKRLVNCASVVPPRELLAWTYFLRA
jgi:hypothetical protein